LPARLFLTYGHNFHLTNLHARVLIAMQQSFYSLLLLFQGLGHDSGREPENAAQRGDHRPGKTPVCGQHDLRLIFMDGQDCKVDAVMQSLYLLPSGLITLAHLFVLIEMMRAVFASC